MIQQMQTACNECRGKGETIREKDRCTECYGKKLIPEPKVLEVHVDKGMLPGQNIVFYGEGEQEPGLEAGDIIVVLREKKDPEIDNLFKRVNNDHLLYKHTLTLSEALTGFDFYIKHLDGRHLHIVSEKGDVIKPGDTKIVENEGMPVHKRPFDKGRLILQFDVVFPRPDQLDDSKRAALLAILPKPAKTSTRPDETPDCPIEEVSIKSPDEGTNPDGSAKRQRSVPHPSSSSSSNANGGAGDEMEDEEEEDGQHRAHGAHQAQCMNCIM